MQKPDMDSVSLRLEQIWTETESRIIQDIARRIQQSGEITSTADYQINRLAELGKSTEEIENILKDALDATYPEMYELYDKISNWEYVRNKDLYEQINGHSIPPEENEYMIQITEAIKEQTLGELNNLAQSYGFSVMMGSRRVYMPFAQYYQQYVDAAIMDVISGGFDYNTVIRRAVTQMTNSGLRTVDYATGHSNRVSVAARRSVMTGVGQITAKINERNASLLGTEYFEVDWHAGARPEHAAWQGKVYSKTELETVCGLGTVTGLCGANCYHLYYPFIPGVSERLYTDEWLDEQNQKEAQTKEWNGQEYNVYQQTQKMRQMETAMRAQREKVDALRAAKADPDEIMIARAKYQAQLNEYARFCKKMGLKEQRERIYYDMRGRVAPRSKTPINQFQNKTKSIVKTSDSGIIKAKDDKQRNMANGQRRSPLYILKDDEISALSREAESINIPLSCLSFNTGNQTGFIERTLIINIRGDVLPDTSSNNIRDLLSSKAVLAHEYYGHYMSHPSAFRIGDWRDEFRASYKAAINTPNLTNEERRMLMLDAYDRAREAGVPVKYNKEARRLIYGYDD